MKRKLLLEKRLISLLLAMVLVMGSLFLTPISKVDAAVDNDGYTVITSAAQLDAVRNDLSGKYRLGSDIDLTVYKSANNTSSKGWYPIGYGSSFTGIFDGNGYTISGLWSKWGISYNGLFSVINGGTIENLNVKLDDKGITGGYEVGGVAGVAKNGAVIEDCIVSGGSITVTGGGYAGGLVGNVYGTPSVSIEFCSVENTIVKTSGNYAGGLVGALKDKAYILGTSSSAKVTAGTSYAGGLIGAAYGNSRIVASFATGEVNAKYYAGGLIGTLYGKAEVEKSYATGNVSTKNYIAGGLVGEAVASNIKNCYAWGDVKGTTGVGGLVGYFSGNGSSNNKSK